LRELETESGSVKGQSDLTHYVTKFYSTFYSLEARLPGTQEAQDCCWDSVLARVTDKANASLIQNLTLDEVLKTIQALPKNKAPSHDGIPIEFF
jgi:hypothetical protein